VSFAMSNKAENGNPNALDNGTMCICTQPTLTMTSAIRTLTYSVSVLPVTANMIIVTGCSRSGSTTSG